MKVICRCGREFIPSHSQKSRFKLGQRKSLYCSKECNPVIGRVLHGMARSRVYKIWQSILDRTINQTSRDYKTYTKGNGGVPIFLDPMWRKFENFYADMGQDNGLSLDRKDPTKGYFKDNCRWATKAIQATNKKAYGKSGFLGVIVQRGKKNLYKAQIGFEKKVYHIGCFPLAKLASLAYQSCRSVLYGDIFV